MAYRSCLLALALLPVAACCKSAPSQPVTPAPDPAAPVPAANASAPALSPSGGGVVDGGASGPVERERATLVVDGVEEVWRLEWRGPPKEGCFEDNERATCPCDGAHFGESGELDLVRSRPGRPDERLGLGERLLPRYPERDGEGDEKYAELDLADIRARPSVTILAFGDYDHDGRATEFLLRDWAGPCGHQQTQAVGVSRRDDRLHLFGTAERPDAALVLESPAQWAKVRDNLSAQVTAVGCGDHGHGTDDLFVIRADAAGLHVEHRRYECIDLQRDEYPFYRRGRLLFAKPWGPEWPD